MENEWIQASAVEPLTGDEELAGTNATVRDFWAFAMGDLRTNNVRGYLAEFLVAKAVGATGRRVEWDAFDVLTPAGVRVEVKSAGYLQVWDQAKPSTIAFSGLMAKTWSPREGYAQTKTFNADVYVFALQTAREHDAYDPLDVSQWRFYVVPRRALEACGYASLGLRTVETLAGGAVSYADLGVAIDAASA
ncbi:hypothetical protein FB554_2397 [Barrientosiimonas humi]|uniref:Uncharacterized protein n=1 Tax=Barrientosiimonas humi TaxID=999931 RepID=A0A542XEH9_9MICO|nr:hypothetical protein [Barrientosiimonas humi]TQL34234.1 hypothetical protein FB554_2397 [Barrientosiimonas humi]CAG7574226.1 hypothetical protein BH39T_PBIAJDOK_02869 [Barrientosiimonas humi]